MPFIFDVVPPSREKIDPAFVDNLNVLVDNFFKVDPKFSLICCFIVITDTAEQNVLEYKRLCPHENIVISASGTPKDPLLSVVTTGQDKKVSKLDIRKTLGADWHTNIRTVDDFSAAQKVLFFYSGAEKPLWGIFNFFRGNVQNGSRGIIRELAYNQRSCFDMASNDPYNFADFSPVISKIIQMHEKLWEKWRNAEDKNKLIFQQRLCALEELVLDMTAVQPTLVKGKERNAAIAKHMIDKVKSVLSDPTNPLNVHRTKGPLRFLIGLLTTIFGLGAYAFFNAKGSARRQLHTHTHDELQGIEKELKTIAKPK